MPGVKTTTYIRKIVFEILPEMFNPLEFNSIFYTTNYLHFSDIEMLHVMALFLVLVLYWDKKTGKLISAQVCFKESIDLI